MKYKTLSVNSFAKRLINWYLPVQRPLPWRKTRDPYIIWVSEIILQQTRVNQGLPYFNNFLACFPDLKSLSNANQTQILKAWEGLGYYSRARNMLKCAKVIVRDFDGQFPSNFSKLIQLPGIGKYTAAAIASFAYHEPVPVIDGNVVRVLTRLYRIKGLPAKAQTANMLWTVSEEMLSKSEPHFYNQAMMELGSMICKPAKPLCHQCPVSDFCQGYKKGDLQKYPSKKAKAELRKRYFNYVILKSGEKTYLQLRSKNDIWKGLYEFLLVESKNPLEISEVLDQVPESLLKEPEVIYESPELKHSLSHQEIRARFIEVKTRRTKSPAAESGRMYKRIEVQSLPKSVLISNYLEDRPI